MMIEMIAVTIVKPMIYNTYMYNFLQGMHIFLCLVMSSRSSLADS